LSCSRGCCGTASGGWAGLVAAVEFALQAAALGLGSVLLVQALIVTVGNPQAGQSRGAVHRLDGASQHRRIA
jgi:hypothetical protein